MGQKNLKGYRRALHRTAQEEKNNIVSRYMTDNWDKVVVSTVSLIRQFNFKNRFSIAMTILFKPEKRPTLKTVLKKKQKTEKGGWLDKESLAAFSCGYPIAGSVPDRAIMENSGGDNGNAGK